MPDLNLNSTFNHESTLGNSRDSEDRDQIPANVEGESEPNKKGIHAVPDSIQSSGEPKREDEEVATSSSVGPQQSIEQDDFIADPKKHKMKDLISDRRNALDLEIDNERLLKNRKDDQGQE